MPPHADKRIASRTTLPVLPPSTPMPRETAPRRRTIVVWIGDTPFQAQLV